jgi:hypothetical protein
VTCDDAQSGCVTDTESATVSGATAGGNQRRPTRCGGVGFRLGQVLVERPGMSGHVRSPEPEPPYTRRWQRNPPSPSSTCGRSLRRACLLRTTCLARCATTPHVAALLCRRRSSDAPLLLAPPRRSSAGVCLASKVASAAVKTAFPSVRARPVRRSRTVRSNSPRAVRWPLVESASARPNPDVAPL